MAISHRVYHVFGKTKQSTRVIKLNYTVQAIDIDTIIRRFVMSENVMKLDA